MSKQSKSVRARKPASDQRATTSATTTAQIRRGALHRGREFQAGVEYVLRSLPPWWDAFLTLNDEMRSGLTVIIAATVREMRKAGE